MKRVISCLLSLVMLLSLLSACQQPPVTESDPLPSAAVDEPSAQELADAVFPFSGCDEALETEVLDADAVSVYLENAYGLDEDTCTDAAIIRGAGMSAFEITVLRLSSEDAARDGADRLKDYLHTRESDFTGYAPAEADMVSTGHIQQEGAWLGLFICPDPEGVEDAFRQALHGVVIPKVLPDSVTDMKSLKDAMLYQCRDELTELGGYRVSMFGSTEDFPQQAEDTYGVPASQLADGFVIHGPEGSLFEVAVLRIVDQDTAAQYMTDDYDLFGTYVDRAAEPFFTLDDGGVRNIEDPEPYTYITRNSRIQDREFLALLICEDPRGTARQLQTALSSLRNSEQPPAVPSPKPRPPIHDLLFRLLYTACPEWKSIFKAWYTDGNNWAPEQLETTYGISPGQYVGFVGAEWWPGTSPNQNSHGVSVYGLYIFRTKGEDEAKALLQPLNDYLAAQVEKYHDEGDAEKEALLQNAQAVQYEEYAVLIISDHTEETVTELSTALTDEATNGWFQRWIVDRVDPAASVSTPEPEESLNPEGAPTFLETNWKAPEGEPDPNHPGRLIFTPPNEEDMSIYDTSAILAAWAASDPSPLSGYDRKIYDAAKAVLDEVLTDGMSDYDKEVAIYAWIVKNVDYDYTSTDVLAETARDAYGPYGGLVNHATVCLGYSTTFQLLADLAGLDCITVVGAASSSEGDHAWNMVRLDGNWYCVDATWDANAREQDVYPSGWVWRFFNVTSDYMARTNHQWDYDSVPEAVTEGHGQS